MIHCPVLVTSFVFTDTSTTEIYTLSLHDALPISGKQPYGALMPVSTSQILHPDRYVSGDKPRPLAFGSPGSDSVRYERSEEHTSELQSLRHLVCRLLLEKKKK